MRLEWFLVFFLFQELRRGTATIKYDDLVVMKHSFQFSCIIDNLYNILPVVLIYSFAGLEKVVLKIQFVFKRLTNIDEIAWEFCVLLFDRNSCYKNMICVLLWSPVDVEIFTVISTFDWARLLQGRCLLLRLSPFNLTAQ